MKIKLTSSSILAGIALLGASFVQSATAQGAWSFAQTVNPKTCWSNNGVVVKASNLGPTAGSTITIQPVTVDGITFDTNLSNIVTGGDGSDFNSGYIPETPAVTSYYYDGTNSSVFNLVNTFAWCHEWWNPDTDKDLYINFSSLVVGHNYQFQLMIGFPWQGNAVNLYGGDADATYGYFYNSNVAVTNLVLATFTWTATASTATFQVDEPAYPLYSDEQEYPAYALIDTSETPAAPTISSPQLLGGGQFKLTINSAPNETFAILISHDLVNWTTNAAVVNVSGGDTFTNSAATSSPTFYRLLQQ